VRKTLSALLAAATSATLVGSTFAAPAQAAIDSRIDYTEWSTTKAFSSGSLAGVRVARGRLRLAAPVGRVRYVDPHGGPAKTYDFGRWTSRWSSPGFGFTELIPSWDATTRRDSWIQVQVRGKSEAGRRSSWDTLARWSAGDASFHRTSLGSQSDDMARVATDTWKSNYSTEFTSWQLRVTLFRKHGTRTSPIVDTVGAMTSRLPQVSSVVTSRAGVARGVTLNVPRYSQMIHRGEYPQYGNGGEAWCSPTSTSMVLGYYGRLPSSDEYSWVNTSYRNRFVDHAARMTYDYAYRGTGNWPFNTAYAATYTNNAFVTRLRSLTEAERFIKAGIPVVASIAFGPGDLDGAPISASNGHLVVIVGFTTAGNVVVNDPAARTNRAVRRTYDRGQFENAWVPTSGGLSYIIRTDDRPLPARGRLQNW
jgi:hypothetical protein